MNEDHERDVQDWFNRSVEALPHQPFTLAVLDKVRRRERLRKLQRHAALLVAFFSLCLLLPELIVPLRMLVTLPLTLLAAVDAQWPWLLLLLAGPACWIASHARSIRFLHGG